MKKIILCLLIAALVLSFSGCMGLDIDKKDIAVTTYNSPINNGGIGTKYIDGLKLLTGEAVLCYFENLKSSEFEENFKKIAQEKHDVIFATHNYGWPILREVSATNSKIMFGIADVYETLPSNVFAINYRYYEGSYLAGFVAGKSLKGNKIGILTETDSEITKKFINSFKAGVITSAGADVEFEEKVLGYDYDNDMANTAATELYDNGCEIIFQDLITPDGAINAAEVKNRFIIGMGVDQSVKSSSAVLTTVDINYDIAFSTTVRKYLHGENIGGKAFEYGVSDFVISLARTNKNVHKDIFSECNKIKENIINGSIKVPVTDEELAAAIEYAKANPPAPETSEEAQETPAATENTPVTPEATSAPAPETPAVTETPAQ